MLRRWAAVWLVAVATVSAAGTAAANPFEPGDPCVVEPTSVECEQWLREHGQAPETGEATCSHPLTAAEVEMLRVRGIVVDAAEAGSQPAAAAVPCEVPRRGWWIGGPWGCWVTAAADGHPPPQAPLLDIQVVYEPDPDPQAGRWWSASCVFLLGATWPVEPVWLNTPPQTAADPAEVAFRALAQLSLTPPQPQLAPPAGGSVPVGMPVWLGVQETTQGWEPVQDGPYCDGPVCVWLTARVTHVEWDPGDGSATVRCTREQHVAWRPGMDPMRPAGACHHFYTAASRRMDGGRYQLTATSFFRVDWSGAGQSGSFVDISDVCAGEVCQTTIPVRVDEIQVLVTR